MAPTRRRYTEDVLIIGVSEALVRAGGDIASVMLRLRWLGHVLRMPEDRLPRRALFVQPSRAEATEVDIGWVIAASLDGDSEAPITNGERHWRKRPNHAVSGAHASKLSPQCVATQFPNKLDMLSSPRLGYMFYSPSSEGVKLVINTYLFFTFDENFFKKFVKDLLRLHFSQVNWNNGCDIGMHEISDEDRNLWN
ncbi:hypothetical protein T265_06652 [Opisthorchis viverrini]|uniref:Uncharacterized protein n=1 Tax=Opisthorchis viverrini TaxID=6198 RepID=A0A074ZFQ1_OPIVI|nr:hypothetical protein T265_06652 [Opisthorchis viverrini]KER26018.1 hypothetical protein T265_06652 [Opisthorchis viverrini]